MGLDGPSRTIEVTPEEAPAEPLREQPPPDREPAPRPQREREPVPA
jgi:hypothetical protein